MLLITKDVLKNWLLKHTQRTLIAISEGERGQLSKITEEYLELLDALAQQNRKLSFIEACDLVDASLAFEWNQFHVPSLLMILLVYVRRIYKPIRNRVYDFVGLQKEYFNGEK